MVGLFLAAPTRGTSKAGDQPSNLVCLRSKGQIIPHWVENCKCTVLYWNWWCILYLLLHQLVKSWPFVF